MLSILSILFIILIQLIYISGTDIPFYYKEIMYDWNYTMSHNIKFDKKLEWVSLISNKGKLINILKEQERATLIQTDLFSQQQNINIHENLNTLIITLIITAIIYFVYTSINTIMYKHEKQKIIYFVIQIILILIITIYLYNTELITSILYKTHFTYTDNIYIINKKETTAVWIIMSTIGLCIYYFNCIKRLNKRKISRFSIYIVIMLLSIISENTLIGVEYLYFFIYVESLSVAIYIKMTLNR